MTAFHSELATPPPSRRRRERRRVAPLGAEGRDATAEELARRVDPTVGFFLLLPLAAGVAALGLLLDSPALLVAAALVSPMLAPAFGVALAGVTGALRFCLRSAIGLLVGLGLAVAVAAIVAWPASRFLRLDLLTASALAATRPTFFDFLLAAVGGALAALALARSLASARLPAAALAYEVLIALAAAAFGWVAGQPATALSALVALAQHLAFVALAAGLAFLGLGLRPVRSGRALLGVDLAAASAVALLTLLLAANVALIGFRFRRPAAIAMPMPSPTATSTPTPPPPTSTLRPSATLALALTSTPIPPTSSPIPSPTLTPPASPTPVLARVQSAEAVGAVVRDLPDGRIVGGVPEGALVRILEIGTVQGEFLWMRVVDAFGQEGWMASVNLATVTPVP